MTTLYVGSTVSIPLPVLSVHPTTLVETAADPASLVAVVTCSPAAAVTYTYGVDAEVVRDGVGLYRLEIDLATAGATVVVVTTVLNGRTGVDRRTFTVAAV